MNREFFDVEISFGDKPPVRMNDLTREQMGALKAIFDAAPGSKEWRTLQHGYTPPFAWKFGHIWRRALQWMAPLLLLAPGAPAIAQRPVEPVRVVIKAQAGDELTEAVRGEMRRLRDVAIVTRNPDYEVHLSGKLIASGSCRGVAGAVLIVRRSDGLHALTVYTGGEYGELAAFIVETINAESFAEFRAHALQKRK